MEKPPIAIVSLALNKSTELHACLKQKKIMLILKNIEKC
jgi:hypothetical protein